MEDVIQQICDGVFNHLCFIVKTAKEQLFEKTLVSYALRSLVFQFSTKFIVDASDSEYL